MSNSWRRCKLGDLLEIKHGYAFLGEHFADAGSHIVLTPGNFHDEGGFKDKGSKEKWYTGPIPADYVLNEGDLLIAMTEQSEGLLGSSALVPRSGRYLHNQRLGLVRIRDSSKADIRFLYYLFNTKKVRQQIRGSASGAKIRHTAPSRIAEVNIHVPPLETQRRIAAILSAFDDLIENNQRRIKILGEMAHTLYREWFIEHRFQGHEETHFMESALGTIPRGWEVQRLGDRFKLVLGGTPSRARPEYWTDGSIPWINSGKTNDFRVIEPSELITPFALEKSSAKLMPSGTTILAITGATLGQVSYLEIDTAANQSVVGVIDESERFAEWIYLTISARIQEIIKHASGGAQQHINKEIVSDVLVAIPPPEIAARFRQIARPIFRQIGALSFLVQNLRRTQEILLHRLLAQHPEEISAKTLA